MIGCNKFLEMTIAKRNLKSDKKGFFFFSKNLNPIRKLRNVSAIFAVDWSQIAETARVFQSDDI